MENRAAGRSRTLQLTDLPRSHYLALALGLLAALGEGVANLLDPWPLKIVLDDVLREQPVHGWLSRFILSTVGRDSSAILKFAVLAVFFIAVAEALCSYAEKYLTTSVGQWVMHDLRRTLYSHIQRLSLGFAFPR